MASEKSPTFRALPARARAYIATVLVVAPLATVAVAGLMPGPPLQPALFALVALVCLAAGAFEVLAPGNYSFQPNLVFFFWGAVLLPPWAIAAAALLCFLPGYAINKFRWYMVAFNAANYALMGLAIHAITHAAGWSPLSGGHHLVGAIAVLAAALVAVAVNHVLLVLVISFTRGRPLGQSARALLDSVPLDLALTLTGACLAALWEESPALAVFAAGPMLLIYHALFVPALRHKSRTDPKTGLFNSAHFRQEFADALVTARKRRSSLSVVMLDVDHLRLVNNRFGHLAGDHLIEALAGLLSEAVTGRGIAARFGGEEFCLLLPNTSVTEARTLAESLRVRLEGCSWAWGEGSEKLTMTVSAGVAGYPDHGDDVTVLTEAADAALYDAKLGGRNRVRSAISQELRATLDPPGGHTPAPVGDRMGVETRAGEDRSSRERRAADPGAPIAPSAGGPPSDGALRAARPEPAAQPAERGRSHARLVPFLVVVLILGVAGAALASDIAPILAAPVLFGLLVASFVLLDVVRIDLFERAQISPASVPVMALAFLFGPLGPLAAEAVIAVIRCVRREPTIKWTFDLGSLGLAGVVAAVAFRSLPTGNDLEIFAVAALAGVAYYAVNIVLLATVMALSEGKRVVTVWRERLAWLWPHYVGFGVVAGTFEIVERNLGLTALVFFAVPLVALWVAQKQYVDRSRSSVTELRESHGELERANRQLRGLLQTNQELLGSMHRSYLSTITSLARTIEAKDPYTGGHTERVSRVTAMLAREVGFGEEELRAVEVGAVIHDIGKIGVPDEILLKPGRLTDSEFAEMRRHPEMSSYIVAELELPPIVKQMVRSHHERFDGSGYPDGLAGEEIPMAARLLTVADALDAMTSDRSYRRALPLAVAVAEITGEAGTQFCPAVVDALAHCLERDPSLGNQYEDEALGRPAEGPDDRQVTSAGHARRPGAGAPAPGRSRPPARPAVAQRP